MPLRRHNGNAPVKRRFIVRLGLFRCLGVAVNDRERLHGTQETTKTRLVDSEWARCMCSKQALRVGRVARSSAERASRGDQTMPSDVKRC